MNELLVILRLRVYLTVYNYRRFAACDGQRWVRSRVTHEKPRGYRINSWRQVTPHINDHIQEMMLKSESQREFLEFLMLRKISSHELIGMLKNVVNMMYM